MMKNITFLWKRDNKQLSINYSYHLESISLFKWHVDVRHDQIT